MNTAASITRPSIVRIVWQAALPNGCNKGVLACLAWHAVLNEHDQCWPHIDTLARMCCLQRRATENNLKALAKAGLITTTQRPGTSNLYWLNRAALIALSSELPAADRGAENDMGGAEKARKMSFSAPIREKEGREKEEGREMEGTPTFPPLPIFEDLKTEQPKTAVDDVLAHIADKRAEHLPIGGGDIRDLIEAAAASGEVPLAVAADAVRGCLPTLDAPASAAPAEPVIAPIVTPPAPARPVPALAVAIAPDTLAAVNAQRVRNGKTAFKRAELLDLHREATLAGIAPQTAAEWILGRPGRNFFRADFASAASLTTPAVAPAGPVELTDAGRAVMAMRARYEAGLVLPQSAGPITVPARPAAPLQTITRRSGAPTAVGGSTGKGWARTAVERFTAGQYVSGTVIKDAASVLCLSLADLKAQRAANTAGVAA